MKHPLLGPQIVVLFWRVSHSWFTRVFEEGSKDIVLTVFAADMLDKPELFRRRTAIEKILLPDWPVGKPVGPFF